MADDVSCSGESDQNVQSFGTCIDKLESNTSDSEGLILDFMISILKFKMRSKSKCKVSHISLVNHKLKIIL